MAAQRSLLKKHRHTVLEEEGVAFGCLANPFLDRAGHGLIAEEITDKGLRIPRVKRLQEDGRRVELASGPLRALIEQLGAGNSQEEDRCFSGPIRHVID